MVANPFIAPPFVRAQTFGADRPADFVELAEFHDDGWIKKTRPSAHCKEAWRVG